VNRGGSTDLDD